MPGLGSVLPRGLHAERHLGIDFPDTGHVAEPALLEVADEQGGKAALVCNRERKNACRSQAKVACIENCLRTPSWIPWSWSCCPSSTLS
eukprot:1155615-Pelagomonas_calceolata.AAC.3